MAWAAFIISVSQMANIFTRWQMTQDRVLCGNQKPVLCLQFSVTRGGLNERTNIKT